MATGSVVVVRRTISQTLVPYKDVEEKILSRRFGSTKNTNGVRFGSTSNVNTVQDRRTAEWRDSTRRHNERTSLERSRSEVCLRRKSSYVRETSLDNYEERKEEITLPVFRRRDLSRRCNSTKMLRPQSDFFPEFEVQVKSGDKKENITPEQRLGQSIATLRRDMMALRRQDRQLLSQLTSLNEHIKDLKELAQLRGGLFASHDDDEGSCVSCEDEVDTKERLTPGTPQTNNSRVRPKSVMSPTRNNNDKSTTPRNSINDKNVEVKKRDSVPRPQETSFEYIEQPSRAAAAPSPQAPVKKSGKTPVTTQVSRKTSVRLERKSLSCQVLNSANSTAGKKNSLMENTESNRHSIAVTGKQLKDLKNFDSTPQKSLSMSHLKRATKTEASTSDSECSTSGCYGGSSTGSEMELERNLNCCDFLVDEGPAFNAKNKVLETKLKSEKKPKRYPSTSEVVQFRKQIVSV